MFKARRKKAEAEHLQRTQQSLLTQFATQPWLRDQKPSSRTRWKRCQSKGRPRTLHCKGCLGLAREGLTTQQRRGWGRRPQPAPGHGALPEAAPSSARALRQHRLSVVFWSTGMQNWSTDLKREKEKKKKKKRGGYYFTCMILRPWFHDE